MVKYYKAMHKCTSYLHCIDPQRTFKTFHALLEFFVAQVMQSSGPLGTCAAVFGKLPCLVVILWILQYVT